MYRIREILLALCLFVLCLMVAGMAGEAGASYPAGSAPAGTDPYHHLSGVVAMRLTGGDGLGMADGGMHPASFASNFVRNPQSVFGSLLAPPVFGPNVDATLNNSATQNETTIGIDPTSDQRVIAGANDYRANLKPYIYYSTDGGDTWVNYAVPGTHSIYYGDPAMAFDRGGYAYFSNLGYINVCDPSGGMYVSNSTDFGASFSEPITVATNFVGGGLAIFHDKEYVAVDDNPSSPYSGTVYLGWTKFMFQSGTGCGGVNSQLGAPIVFSRSTDHGLSWSVPITASPPISNNNQGSLPVIGTNGEVYLYYVGAATQSQINYNSVLFSRSTDGGQTFPFFTRISDLTDLPSPLPPTNFRNNPFGAMAADKQIYGYLYAVWADYRNGDADILLSRSTDDGNSWSAPQRVNDDPVANGKDQFFPWITASADGSIHIGWFDRREDAANRNYKEYYTVSYDHGATWEPNVAVSSAASNPGTSTFIGDYSGIGATTGVVIPIWTDIRTGTNQNAYVARGVYTVGPTLTPTPTEAPTNTATPTATDTPTSSPTLVSTATATSTNTPVTPPSNTPTNTAVVPPTGTPTNTPIIVPTPTSTMCPIQFTDVPEGSTFYSFIRCLACRGIINGYTTGCVTGSPCFKPNDNVTRGQVAKIVSNAAGFNEPATSQQYEDVPVGSTFFDFIWRLTVRGYVNGYPCGGPGEPCGGGGLPYFRPNADVTRGQITKIVSNAAQYNETATGQQFQDVAPGSTFYDFIYRLVIRNIMSGYPCGGAGEPCVSPDNLPYFRPGASATRGQTSKIVANTFYPSCDTPSR